MTKAYSFAIVGATGAVGEKMVQILEGSELPVKQIKLLSSSRSAGSKVMFRGEEIVVEEATANSFVDIDIALFSAGGDISRKLIPKAVEHGAICIDNTSAFRMDENVPLVVPEVNEADLFHHQGIIANPNCSTIQMVAALEPLNKAFGLKRVVVSTYQAVSGAGAAAVDELMEQTTSLLNNEEVTANILPVKSGTKHHQIAFNCIPQIDQFHENGFTLEELKMMNETKKIMHLPNLPIAATCVRLPIVTGHSESVYIELEQDGATVKAIQDLLREAAGVTLQDDPSKQFYPMPVKCVNQNDVFVGRIRQDADIATGFHLWIVSDNLLKGAAWNSVQIAESLVRLEIV